MIGRIARDPSNVGGRFDGYTSQAETEKKILRNVFAKGDAWFATGDLMRKDDQGYFYFVDRLGDTFRWKGENVATAEVADAITAHSAIADADVYGVSVPGTEGRRSCRSTDRCTKTARTAEFASDAASSGSPGIDSEHAAGDISAAIAKEILNGV